MEFGIIAVQQIITIYILIRVYIGGTVSGITSSTGALWNAANTSTRNYRNNILYNARSGGTRGKHYAISLAGTTGLTIDYNDYFVSGTGDPRLFNIELDYPGFVAGGNRAGC